jgi:hypothetical protein
VNYLSLAPSSEKKLKLLIGTKELGIIIPRHKILTVMSQLKIIYLGQNCKPELILVNKGSG